MKTGFWVAITVAAAFLGYLGGYGLSSSTGIQPGYFEAAEAGGYGGGGDGQIQGLDKDAQEYYKDLYEE